MNKQQKQHLGSSLDKKMTAHGFITYGPKSTPSLKRQVNINSAKSRSGVTMQLGSVKIL